MKATSTVRPEAWERPLPDALYLSRRERIFSGALPPGAELRQETLARHYGVSRVPMREAMSRLQAEGLIVLRPRRGFAVTSLDLAEIVEVFELRMVLEQHALEVATRRRSEADIEAAEAVLLRMEALDLAKPDDVSQWLDLNRSFHTILIASSRRGRLSNITCTLRDMVEPYIRMEFYLGGGVENAAVEHRALLEAYRERAADRAGSISRDHCLNAMNRLLDGVRSRDIGGKAGGRVSTKKTFAPLPKVS